MQTVSKKTTEVQTPKPRLQCLAWIGEGLTASETTNFILSEWTIGNFNPINEDIFVIEGTRLIRNVSINI